MNKIKSTRSVLSLALSVSVSILFLSGGKCPDANKPSAPTGGGGSGQPTTEFNVKIAAPSSTFVKFGNKISLSAVASNAKGTPSYAWTLSDEGDYASLSNADTATPTLKTEKGSKATCIKFVKVNVSAKDDNGKEVSDQISIKLVNESCFYSSSEKGLPSNNVTALSFSKGTLWVGTDAGIVSVTENSNPAPAFGARITWSNSKLNKDYIGALYAGQDRIWTLACSAFRSNCIGAQGFDPAASDLTDEAKWVRYSTPDTLKSNDVNVITSFNGQMLFGTQNGLAVVNADGTSTNLRPGQFVTSLAQDSKQRLWIGTGAGRTNGEGIWVSDDATLTSGHLFSGKEWTDDSNISIGALAGDKNKNMWVGLNWGVGGVVKYTPASSGVLSEGTWGKVMSFPGYAEVHVTAMVRDRDGNIWVGTNHGLGKIPHDLAPATPLPALLTYNGDLKSVSSLAYDEVNHVLWIGQKGSAKALFRRQLGL